jgi:hypothetical protein
MIKKNLLVIIMLAVALTSCSPADHPVTNVLAVVDLTENVAYETPPPTPSPTPSPTPAPTSPPTLTAKLIAVGDLMLHQAQVDHAYDRTTGEYDFDHAFSDIFGKSATAILNHILEHPGENFDVTPFIHRGCKTPIEEIQLSIDGNISLEQTEKLKVIRSHMDSLELCKANLESVIFTLAEPLTPQIDLVSTVPGIKDFSAIAVIAEIGVDMSVFPTSKHLCSWAGLAPQCNESGGKKKSSRVSKAGAYIKPLLIQCANAVVKSNKHPEIKNRFLAIKKRRGHKKAIIAIARMLLNAVYHILKKNEPYNPELYRQSDVSPVDRVEQAVKLLEKNGFVVSQNTDIH